MKLRSWLKYLVYCILIFGFIFVDKYIDEKCACIVAYNMEALRYYYIRTAISTVTCMAVGALLGLDVFLAERKKTGSWKINWPKFVFLWIPSLFFVVSSFILIITIFFSSSRLFSIYDILPIFRILLGYFTVTSFYKQAKKT